MYDHHIYNIKRLRYSVKWQCSDSYVYHSFNKKEAEPCTHISHVHILTQIYLCTCMLEYITNIFYHFNSLHSTHQINIYLANLI